MITKFVGIKELRQNMAKLSEAAQKNGERLIVLRKNKPIFELKPLSDEEALVESLTRELDEAEEDIQKGHFYTQEEMAERLGL